MVPKLCTSVATGSPPASAPVLVCNCLLRGRPLTSGAWYQTCSGFAWSFRVEAPFRPGQCHVMGGLLCPVWHLMSPCGGLPSQRCDDRKSGVRRLLGSRQSSAHDCHGGVCWWQSPPRPSGTFDPGHHGLQRLNAPQKLQIQLTKYAHVVMLDPSLSPVWQSSSAMGKPDALALRVCKFFPFIKASLPQGGFVWNAVSQQERAHDVAHPRLLRFLGCPSGKHARPWPFLLTQYSPSDEPSAQHAVPFTLPLPCTIAVRLCGDKRPAHTALLSSDLVQSFRHQGAYLWGDFACMYVCIMQFLLCRHLRCQALLSMMLAC